jgi:hypothetical protein
MILLWIMILRLIGLIDVLDVRILINCEKTLSKNLDSKILRLKMMRFHFGPSILEIYNLVLEL